MKCNECGGENLTKNGSKIFKGARRQKYRCKDCGADVKGEIIEYLTKGKVPPQGQAPDIETKKEPEKKPGLKNMMHKI